MIEYANRPSVGWKCRVFARLWDGKEKRVLPWSRKKGMLEASVKYVCEVGKLERRD